MMKAPPELKLVLVVCDCDFPTNGSLSGAAASSKRALDRSACPRVIPRSFTQAKNFLSNLQQPGVARGWQSQAALMFRSFSEVDRLICAQALADSRVNHCA